MRIIKWICVTFSILLLTKTGISQQLRLGDNPSSVEKSAVLDLVSTNQGLLLPRISDTTLINALNPPNGMIIYFTPANKLLVRSNGNWQGVISNDIFKLSNLTDASISLPQSGQILQYNGSAWINSTPAFLTAIDTSDIANFSQKVRGLFTGIAPISINANGQISITQAGAASDGYLNNSDWNTFNNKLGSVDTGNISNFYLKVRSLISAGSGISYNTGTGVISNSGVLSLNGNTGALTMDTGYISNFHLKVKSLNSVTAPLTYNSSTGVYGITQATTSTNGYLSSTDWNTFNNKQSSGNFLSDPGGNGIVARTALNTTINRTITGTSNKITVTNGDGVSGNPTINVGSDIVDKTTATTYTGGAKQTFLNSASTAGLNLTASADPSTPASGDFWNSTTTANSLKYRDAASTTRTLVDLSLSQTLTNKTISGSSNTISNIGNSSLSNSTIGLTLGSTGTDANVSGSPASLGGSLTLNLPSASATNRGLLSAADWTVFNSKASSFTTGNLTESGSGILTITGGTNAVIGTGTTLQVKQANGSQSGFLSSGDWTTFNNKLGSVDTGNISNFYTKVRSLHTVTAPLTYNTSTGLLGITQANTSTNGYLSSNDWNTFNNKQGTGNYMVDPGGNGIVARTALNTTTNRTITGTANRITLTNGDGVSGNPTIDISTSYQGQNTITTLGTISTGTWNGTTIEITNGGTGQTTANAALNALLPSQTGNSGSYLTTDGSNTSWSYPNVTGDNYVYAYSTSTKTFSFAGSWTDLTFNSAHPQLSGWSHSTFSNAQNFTCNQSGLYQVVYSGQVNNTSSSTYELDIRAVLDGTEIPGSISSVQCSNSNPTIANNILVSINSGQVLKLQMTGSNTAIRLSPGAYGTTKPTITITIIRIK